MVTVIYRAILQNKRKKIEDRPKNKKNLEGKILVFKNIKYVED